MLDYIRNILSTESNSESSEASGSVNMVDHQKQLQIATAALFVEMAKADGEFSEEERDQVIESLQKQFGLDTEASEDSELLSVDRIFLI